MQYISSDVSDINSYTKLLYISLQNKHLKKYDTLHVIIFEII